jgi:hypothetical protein
VSDTPSPKPFRFEAMWIRDSRSEDVVEQAWNMCFQGNASFQLCRKIQSTKEALKDGIGTALDIVTRESID